MKMHFSVPDMSCGHCVSRIQTRFEASGQITNLEINLENATLSLDTELSVEEVIFMLDEAGYPATRLSG